MGWARLKRDELRMNHHRALVFWLLMISSENRYTFSDHALALPRKGLAFDRMNLNRAQAPHAQYVQFKRAIDAVAIKYPDQIVDAINIDATQLDHHVARQQTRPRRGAVRFDLSQQGTILFSIPATRACRRGIGTVWPDTPT
jgi:hypothetical protein